MERCMNLMQSQKIEIRNAKWVSKLKFHDSQYSTCNKLFLLRYDKTAKGETFKQIKLQLSETAQYLCLGLDNQLSWEGQWTCVKIRSGWNVWEDLVYKLALVSPPSPPWVQRCCYLIKPCLALSHPAEVPSPGLPLINGKQVVSQGWLLISSQDESKWRSWAMLCNYWFMYTLPEDKRSISCLYFDDRLVWIDTKSLTN